ncbi:MAG TPA: hypothetical protein VGZ00_05930 [Candidatus Baltobacteraceae bacterium]|jgi:hypothetical protein|nr:hypothetical protein [Candidatus Baltobacteraceae bacterium]
MSKIPFIDVIRKDPFGVALLTFQMVVLSTTAYVTVSERSNEEDFVLRGIFNPTGCTDPELKSSITQTIPWVEAMDRDGDLTSHYQQRAFKKTPNGWIANLDTIPPFAGRLIEYCAIHNYSRLPIVALGNRVDPILLDALNQTNIPVVSTVEQANKVLAQLVRKTAHPILPQHSHSLQQSMKKALATAAGTPQEPNRGRSVT